jgi:hypothetical protein
MTSLEPCQGAPEQLFVATKGEFKAALFSIMFSIQRTPELVRSFFQLPSTKYAAQAA